MSSPPGRNPGSTLTIAIIVCSAKLAPPSRATATVICATTSMARCRPARPPMLLMPPSASEPRRSALSVLIAGIVENRIGVSNPRPTANSSTLVSMTTCPRDRLGGYRPHQSHPGAADQEGPPPNRHPEQQRFGDQLACDSQPGRTEGHSNGQLLSARRQPREQHVRDVRAGQEQQQSDHRQEDGQRDPRVRSRDGLARRSDPRAPVAIRIRVLAFEPLGDCCRLRVCLREASRPGAAGQ